MIYYVIDYFASVHDIYCYITKYILLSLRFELSQSDCILVTTTCVRYSPICDVMCK